MKKKNEEMMFLGIDGFSEIENLSPEASTETEKAVPRHKTPVDFKAIAKKVGGKLRASKTKSQPIHTEGGAREHTVYKKKAVIAVGASVTAVMLSLVTVASALGSDPVESNPPKKPAAANAPATVDEALKQSINGIGKGEPAALYIDGRQVGAADDSNKLEAALNQILLDAKEGHDDTTVTSFANSVEVKPYSGKQTTDAQTLVSQVKDMISVRMDTDWIYEEETSFETEVTYDDSLPADYEEITQEGVNGVTKITYRLTYVDGVQVDAVDTKTEVVTEAVPEKKLVGTGYTAAEEETVSGDVPAESESSSTSSSSGSGSASGSFIWPVSHTHNITSYMEWRWGRMHNGLDIAGGDDYGQPFMASDGGTVVWSGDDGGGYGNYVMIDHGNGYMTVYGHASSLACSTGDYVSQGQVIGYVGSTGNSTGPHLHFEIRLNGEYQDPLNYVS